MCHIRGLVTYRLSELSLVLSSQNVEVVGRCTDIRSGVQGEDLSLRWVDDLHVGVLVLSIKLLWGRVDSGLVVAKLQESLQSTRRVLGSLTVVSVRQV